MITESKGWEKEKMVVPALLKGWVDKEPQLSPLSKKLYETLKKQGIKPKNMNEYILNEFCKHHNVNPIRRKK